MKATPAAVGYEVISFEYTLVLPLLAVWLWAGCLTLNLISLVYSLGFVMASTSEV